ncbi:MAG: hypothetical protein PHR07_04500 [Acidaminococcaceae bacterium]|nr:hypothetical protein [Acidaminococcaceae bacterium]
MADFDERDDDLESEDLFDLDLDDDEQDADLDEVVPKARVRELVKKRLAQERKKTGPAIEAQKRFKEVYGVDIDEALKFGTEEKQRMTAPRVDPEVQAQLDANPVVKKLVEIDQWRVGEMQSRQMEREALEFVNKYPGVNYKDIPQEVLDRRKRGGLTLAEAYAIGTGTERMQEAARKAAEGATRDYQSRQFMRTEGPDFSGGSKTDTNTLTDEERKFASNYGMKPKEYIRYRAMLQKMKEE